MTIAVAAALVCAVLVAVWPSVKQSAQTLVPSAGESRPPTQATGADDPIRAQNFGQCVWDGQHDVAPCIQAAIDAAAARGGSVVRLPASRHETWPIATTLRISKSGVCLRGDGNDFGEPWNENGHANNFAVTLRWTGAPGGTMISIGPDPAGPHPVLRVSGVCAEGIMADANNRAAVAWQINSTRFSHFAVGFRDPVRAGMKLDTIAIDEVDDTQENDIRVAGIIEAPSAADGLFLDGTSPSGGNTSMNRIQAATIYNFGTGWAVRLERTDNNHFYTIRANNIKIGSQSADNYIHYITGPNAPKSILCVTGSAGNRFYEIDSGNGVVNPTIEPGASAYVFWGRHEVILEDVRWNDQQFFMSAIDSTRPLGLQTGANFRNMGGLASASGGGFYSGLNLFSPKIDIRGQSFVPQFNSWFQWGGYSDPVTRRFVQSVGGLNPDGTHDVTWVQENDTGGGWVWVGAHTNGQPVAALSAAGDLAARSLNLGGGPIGFGSSSLQAGQIARVSNGGSVAYVPSRSHLRLDGTGTVASYTIGLPATNAIKDGQLIRVISSGVTVAALTLTPGGGQTIIGAPTRIGPEAPFTLIWDGSLNAWLRAGS